MIYKKYIFGHPDGQNIFHIYLVFLPQFLAQSSQNSCNFPSVESDQSLCCVSMVTLRRQIIVGLVTNGANPVGCNFLKLPLLTSGEGEGLEVESVANAQ